jgi:hypothetical protein
MKNEYNQKILAEDTKHRYMPKGKDRKEGNKCQMQESTAYVK